MAERDERIETARHALYVAVRRYVEEERDAYGADDTVSIEQAAAALEALDALYALGPRRMAGPIDGRG